MIPAMDNRTLQNRRILISGASVAGPSLAWWLARHGFHPTVVERAPQLRGGGYALHSAVRALAFGDHPDPGPRSRPVRLYLRRP